LFSTSIKTPSFVDILTFLQRMTEKYKEKITVISYNLGLLFSIDLDFFFLLWAYFGFSNCSFLFHILATIKAWMGFIFHFLTFFFVYFSFLMDDFLNYVFISRFHYQKVKFSFEKLTFYRQYQFFFHCELGGDELFKRSIDHIFIEFFWT